jgi:hypothetical protein
VSEDGRGAWHGGDDGRRGCDFAYDEIRVWKRDLRAWLAGGIRLGRGVWCGRGKWDFVGLGMPPAAAGCRGIGSDSAEGELSVDGGLDHGFREQSEGEDVRAEQCTMWTPTLYS